MTAGEIINVVRRPARVLAVNRDVNDRGMERDHEFEHWLHSVTVAMAPASSMRQKLMSHPSNHV